MNLASREAKATNSSGGDGVGGHSLSRRHRSDLSRVAAKGAFALADVFVGRLSGPKVLIYHQIGPHPSRQMCLAPEVFADQLDWLESNGQIVSLESAVLDSSTDDDRFVLTFDDGYDGVFRHAYPRLLDRGVPFTLYITTGLVSSRGPSEEAGLEALTWGEIGEMAESGLMTVAAHTHSHPDFRSTSSSQVVEELDLSNEMIRERTGVEPRHFAYPKGYWAEHAEPLVRERYDTAVLGGGPAIGPRTDRYRLSRVPIQRADGMFFFKQKLERGLRLEEWARRRVKKYRNPSTMMEAGS